MLSTQLDREELRQQGAQSRELESRAAAAVVREGRAVANLDTDVGPRDRPGAESAEPVRTPAEAPGRL
jgi:hypothetical protein